MVHSLWSSISSGQLAVAWLAASVVASSCFNFSAGHPGLFPWGTIGGTLVLGAMAIFTMAKPPGVDVPRMLQIIGASVVAVLFAACMLRTDAMSDEDRAREVYRARLERMPLEQLEAMEAQLEAKIAADDARANGREVR